MATTQNTDPRPSTNPQTEARTTTANTAQGAGRRSTAEIEKDLQHALERFKLPTIFTGADLERAFDLTCLDVIDDLDLGTLQVELLESIPRFREDVEELEGYLAEVDGEEPTRRAERRHFYMAYFALRMMRAGYAVAKAGAR